MKRMRRASPRAPSPGVGKKCTGQEPGGSPCRLGLGEALVADAVRLVGLGAEAPVTVGFVGLVVALEPGDLGVALEGQDVRGDAIEEPAVVADDHRSEEHTSELQSHVNLVCRLLLEK